MAGRAGQRQACETGEVQRRGGAVLPDDKGAVWVGAAPDAEVRAERAGAVGAGLAGAELQHVEPQRRGGCVDAAGVVGADSGRGGGVVGERERGV